MTPTERQQLNERLAELLREAVEIQNRLQADEVVLSATVKVRSEVELNFDVENRTITWNSGAVKLGKKSFEFVRTIWNGDKHRTTLDKIERKVWGNQKFVRSNTVSVMINWLDNQLKKCNFPYKITPIKNFYTLEIQGYRLKSNRIRKKTQRNLTSKQYPFVKIHLVAAAHCVIRTRTKQITKQNLPVPLFGVSFARQQRILEWEPGIFHFQFLLSEKEKTMSKKTDNPESANGQKRGRPSMFGNVPTKIIRVPVEFVDAVRAFCLERIKQDAK